MFTDIFFIRKPCEKEGEGRDKKKGSLASLYYYSVTDSILVHLSHKSLVDFLLRILMVEDLR